MALVSLLLWTTFVSAQSYKLYPGIPAGYLGELAPRQLFDNFSECTTSDTCGECFGWGYVLCDDGGCFNPDDGEQCCKGGSMCVGLNSSCCVDGPGKPGKDGVIPYSNAPLEEDDENEDSGSAIFCDFSMTGEECCSQAGEDIHWCSGEFPANQCYNSTEFSCCVDGHVCAGEDCCDIVVCMPFLVGYNGSLIMFRIQRLRGPGCREGHQSLHLQRQLIRNPRPRPRRRMNPQRLQLLQAQPQVKSRAQFPLTQERD
ncbi:hypothetical protein BJX70DRAFT_5613 [Aspergillus crustosus]